jgi:hypothetical protein
MQQITNVSPLQVRNPQHKPNGSYCRRLSDFNLRAPVVAAIIVLALFLGGSFWSTYVGIITSTWNGKPVASIVMRTSQMRNLFR